MIPFEPTARGLACALLLAVLTPVLATAQEPPAPKELPKNDYSKNENWLCRPGVPGPCDADQSATVIAAGGKVTTEAFHADPAAPVDCFYVYPTVSTDPGDFSDMTADAAEKNVVAQQFARFGAKCRLFAPMYRQVTLAAVLKVLLGGSLVGQDLPYKDVRDAWRYYLEHDNQGRGFVLIGHSQGSAVLTALIRDEIEGKPVANRMISAILGGTTVAAPDSKDVGGTFQSTPLCREGSQTGCVIAFATFRSTAPPAANTRFGRVTTAGQKAACVNPAELSGAGGQLDAYVSAQRAAIVPQPAWQTKPWTTPEQPVKTPFVKLPGMLTAKCASNANASYLEITVHPDAGGNRVDDIGGELMMGGRPVPSFGLHLIDMNLTMGNLVEIVGRQSKAWLLANRK